MARFVVRDSVVYAVFVLVVESVYRSAVWQWYGSVRQWRGYESSRVWGMGVGVSGRSVQSSSAVSVGEWIGALVRSSWLYRWLTAEPEPEIIVIDLRETVTAGHVIAVIDRVVVALIPAAARSQVGKLWGGLVDRFLAAPVRVSGIGSLVSGMVVLVGGIVGGVMSLGALVIVTIMVVCGGVGVLVPLSWEELQEVWVVEWLKEVFEVPEGME